MKAAETFCLVLIGSVFFRAVDLLESLRVLQQISGRSRVGYACPERRSAPISAGLAARQAS
jgi:hypothetical protein